MPCPYLPGRVERKLFTRLTGSFASEVNSTLSRAGFRRSHDIVYRPVCPSCSACIPVRIPVAAFLETRSMRRVRRRNRDLSTEEVAAVATGEQFRLFTAYQRSRHGDSDMARMGMGDFSAMIDEGQTETTLFETRDGAGRLCGVMLTDRLSDGYSAVYSFFDPEVNRRSLGTFLILQLVARCQDQHAPFVYLGYWISRSRKMAYKARFQPLEALGRDGWQSFVPAIGEGDGEGDGDGDADEGGDTGEER